MQIEFQVPPFIIKSFPLHPKAKSLLTYNLYIEDPIEGTQKCTPLIHPIIRQGCMTTCYFEATKMAIHKYGQPCQNCNNRNSQTFYYDIGLKRFLQEYGQYIYLNQPLVVQLDPWGKEVFWRPSAMKNGLMGLLADYVGGRIFGELALEEMPVMGNCVLNYGKINKIIEGVMKPTVRKKQHQCYDYVKFIPHSSESDPHLHLLLFLHNENDNYPIKVRLYTTQISQQQYLNHTHITYLAQIKTFMFMVCYIDHTQYFVASLNYHFSLEDEIMKVVYLSELNDSCTRREGALLVDQKYNSFFALGGYDSKKGDCLDYVSCFLFCKWEEKEDHYHFVCQSKKDHHLFLCRGNQFGVNQSYRNTFNESKIALRGCAYGFYGYNREETDMIQRRNRQENTLHYKRMFCVGGGVRDSTMFSSGRFSYAKPGIRYITYDAHSTDNPIVSDISTTSKVILDFYGYNYIMMELPFNSEKGNKRRYTNHMLIFGGKPDNLHREEHNLNRIFLLNASYTQKSIRLEEKFKFSDCLTEIISNFAVMLYDKKEEYVRGSFALKQPLKDPYTGIIVRFLVVQFQMNTGVITVTPGYLEPENKERMEEEENI